MAQVGNMPAVGVWDQVLAFGKYQHQTVDGTPCVSVHDASTCKVMLDDFAAHPDCDIFYDKQHEIEDELGGDALDRQKMQDWAQGDGHALGWANAMCMVMGGQVVRYEAHPGAPTIPPKVEDVLLQSDGKRRGDGVYCLRARVTPRGADPVSGFDAFGFTSPYFVPERDGNRLLCLTVTNDPRMRGCALAYSRAGRVAMQRVSSSRTGAPMDNEMMARVGCSDSDSPEVKAEKMTAYIRKMEADIAEKDKASEMARKKMEDDIASMRRQMEEDKAKHAEPDGDEGEEKKVLKAMSRRLSALEEKNKMLEAEVKESHKTAEQVTAMQATARKAKAEEFARAAIAMGRIKGDHKGDEDKTAAWLAAKYEKDAAEAEDLLSAENTFKVSERHAMTRMTRNGAGIGAPDPRGLSVDVDVEYDRAVNKIATDDKVDIAVAMSRVKEKNPDLFRRYVEYVATKGAR